MKNSSIFKLELSLHRYDHPDAGGRSLGGYLPEKLRSD